MYRARAFVGSALIDHLLSKKRSILLCDSAKQRSRYFGSIESLGACPAIQVHRYLNQRR